MPAEAWYYGDVEACWRQGLLEGTSDTAFSPRSDATRAQVAAVLRRLAGGNPSGTVSFDDVASGAWYYDDVRWAAAAGLVEGSDDDGDGVYSFRPEESITRQELMTILYRYAGGAGAGADLSGFGDADRVGGWAKDAVAWAAAADLLRGVSGADGRLLLAPQNRVTRAQLAAFLNRFTQMMS